jgi:cytidylate kinase
MGTDQIPVITVDGPGGSGKGTLSQLLAQKLGYRLLDSGAIYRILALAADWYGITLSNKRGLVRLAANLDARFDTQSQNSRRAWLESRDVTQAIRTEACSHAASRIAQIKEVREALLRRQRAFRKSPGLVADGRDMGTVVFPQAPLKIFLTASLEERAKRRYKQLKEKGISASLDILLNELAKRDERDEERAVAPLKPAKDAIIIDSTDLSIQAVLNKALELAR